jgi:hypothetical protein
MVLSATSALVVELIRSVAISSNRTMKTSFGSIKAQGAEINYRLLHSQGGMGIAPNPQQRG